MKMRMIAGFVMSGLRIIAWCRVDIRGFAFCVQGRWKNVLSVRLRLRMLRSYGRFDLVGPGLIFGVRGFVYGSIHSVSLSSLS
jgi:hypothetical protein